MVSTALQSDGYFKDLLERLKKEPVKTMYSSVGLVGMLAIWLYAGALAGIACNFIGFLYPAYMSVKAIESTDSEDDTEWLMYWVVYSTFSFTEVFSDVLLSWCPFYFLGKCAFLLWCMSPSNNGAKFIYTKLIRPFVKKHEAKIDDALNKATAGAKNVLNNAQNEANEAITTAATDVMKRAINPFAMGKEEKSD
jgi:receptor expression-enhancing protein 5/6